MAEKLTRLLQRADPAHREVFAANLQGFKAQLSRLNEAQVALKKQYPQLKVTASEPVVCAGQSMATPSRVGHQGIGWIRRGDSPSICASQNTPSRMRSASMFIRCRLTSPVAGSLMNSQWSARVNCPARSRRPWPGMANSASASSAPTVPSTTAAVRSGRLMSM